MFRRFGSRVTIIQSRSQLLGGEDADIAGEVASILKQDGIDVLLNTKAERVQREAAQIQVSTRTGDETPTVQGSHLLVATGRTPNTDSLNVAAAGIATDKRGFIRVNAKLETNVECIFALGDIKGGPAFTHISYDDFRILRTNLIDHGNANTKGRMVPYALFIDPQLGRVGLTETEARAKKAKIRVAKMPMNYVARALEIDETRGFLKVIVDDRTERILGAAVLGVEGGEVMSMLQLAMMGKLKFGKLRDGIFAHPTLAEALNNLFTHFQS
jgi:pyruvate/2-oxoglutarate dehydrogenase complex dihydrolipoamide dehydrogenase (E3) component